MVTIHISLDELREAIDRLPIAEKRALKEWLEADVTAEADAKVTQPPKERILGLHAGAIWTSDDFDDPLPDEFWLGEDA